MLGVRVMEEKMSTRHALATKRLVHVLQSTALKQQTGRLNIELVGEQQSEKGEIFFVQGDAVFARTEHETGETALYNMLNWREVHYSFFEGVRAPAAISQHNRPIQRPRYTGPLLPVELEQTRPMPAIRVHAISTEQKEIGQTPAIGVPALPSFATPLPSPIPQLGRWAEEMGQHGASATFQARPQVTRQNIMHRMERRERVVFLLLDGKRTLRDVAYLVHRSELDVAGIILQLLKQGYVEYTGAKNLAFSR